MLLNTLPSLTARQRVEAACVVEYLIKGANRIQQRNMDSSETALEDTTVGN